MDSINDSITMLPRHGHVRADGSMGGGMGEMRRKKKAVQPLDAISREAPDAFDVSGRHDPLEVKTPAGLGAGATARFETTGPG